MTTKVISTYVAARYSLSPIYNTLSITSTGGVGGAGISASQQATIINDGRVTVGSYYSSAIYLKQGGQIINGDPSDTSALIHGRIHGGSMAVQNYGTIEGRVTIGSGSLTNGSAQDHAAAITGYIGVGVGTLTNFSTITATIIGVGGVFANGSASDTSATINGGFDLVSGLGGLQRVPGTFRNFGTVMGSGGRYEGVSIGYKDQVVNGTTQDTTALMYGGYFGVFMSSYSDTVSNFGTISGGTSADGVAAKGGTIVNGSESDTAAVITGRVGVGELNNDRATLQISNFATISGGSSAGGVGAYILTYSRLTNGSVTDDAALIQGYSGISTHGGLYEDIMNFGTVEALSSTGYGVSIDSRSSTLTNYGVIKGGSSGAVVFKYASDVLVVGAGALFEGAVLGDGGTLDLASGTGKLVGLPGAGVITVADQAGPVTTFDAFGTLEIASTARFSVAGGGSIAAGQAVIDDGRLRLHHKVVNAGLIECGGGRIKTFGPVVNTGEIESIDDGRLVLAGAVRNAGTISAADGALLILSGSVTNWGIIAADGGTVKVDGEVSKAGTATIDGGALDIASTFAGKVMFTGSTGVLELGRSQDFTGVVAGFSLSGGTSLDLDDIGFVDRNEATYAHGVLRVTDGVHTANIHLQGDYGGDTFVASSNQHGGVIIVAQAEAPASPPAVPPAATLQLITAMASLGAKAALSVRLSGVYTHDVAMLTGPRHPIA
jgi:hypothetical protein